MYSPINGWTKRKIISHIKKNFKGKSVVVTSSYLDGVETRCFYRGPNETKCAVGIFIPDDKYNKTMEGQRADSIIGPWALRFAMPLNNEGMCSLQKTHDLSDSENTLQIMINWVRLHVKGAK